MKRHNVAPPELIRADWNLLTSGERLAVDSDTAGLLFLQSIEGRAHNGAGSFLKRRYVNTTIEDIVEALDMDPLEIRKQRQTLIDNIEYFVKNVCISSDGVQLIDKKGYPLLSLKFLKNRFFKGKDIIKGFILGGLRDDPQIRHLTEEYYNVRIGYGKLYTVDLNVMNAMGLDAEVLAHEEHEQELEEFHRSGLIVDADAGTDLKNLRYLYIRHKRGPGESDDAAFITAGFLYSVDVAIGIFLADAVDTLEKYAIQFRDRDNEIAKQLQGMFPELNPTQEQTKQLTYLSAIPEGMEGEVPDSSLRYLVMIDTSTNECALQNHMHFIKAEPYHSMLISFERIPTYKFYAYIKQRILELGKPVPVLTKITLEKGLEQKISEFMNKQILVVRPDISVRLVLEQVEKLKAQIIIIQNKKGTVVGALDPKTLLNSMQNK